MNRKLRHPKLSQADIALQIESLVKAIEEDDGPAFWVEQSRHGLELVKNTKLSRYFNQIKRMFDFFDDQVPYDYSEYLRAFRNACQAIGLERSLEGPVCLNESGTAYLSYQQSMNVLVAQIRYLTRQHWYRRSKTVRRQIVKQQEQELMEYADAVMDHYSRTLLVRVNLKYHAECQARLRIEHVFEDLDDLIAKQRRHPIFERLIGYAYAVEQGNRKGGSGYHIHALYFFNGNMTCRDRYKATRIGQLWQEVTCGRGFAHSSNHHYGQLGEKLGVGRILRSDQSARFNIYEVVRYLVKDKQQLCLKPEGARCLRKGAFKRQ
ncbi:hypothetical protein ACP4J5_16415 [Pseudomonas oryzihabitans]|uniref:hypothetical protein n=1 Tax=Pseudomonas oryzihabitans TaxID=47885 RepID=UPI003CF08090